MNKIKSESMGFLILLFLVVMAYFGIKIWLSMFVWLMSPIIFFFVVGYVIYFFKN